MRSNLTGMLAAAQSGGYAIGNFNVYSYETIRGVLEAGAATGTPVIVAFGERYLPNMDFRTVVALCETVAADLTVDYAIHLDHCKSMANCYRALAAGFTSVMYDGSALPFEENLANTAAVVQVAHALGASVEAELGSLASGDNSQESEDNETQSYTDPEQARDFVARTGVDALAVSIGTVHGNYKGEPNVRVDILQDIRAAVDTPLVLHGGSGTPTTWSRPASPTASPRSTSTPSSPPSAHSGPGPSSTRPRRHTCPPCRPGSPRPSPNR